MDTEPNILTLVQECSPWDGTVFDPLTHITAANLLRILPKERVITGLRDYCRLIVNRSTSLEDGTKVFLLLRVLFVPNSPDEPFPPIRIGQPVGIASLPPRFASLYPLALVEDVPLLVAEGYSLGGLAEDPLDHVTYCDQSCRLRPTPLHPPDNPLPLVDELLAAVGEVSGPEQADQTRLLLQAQLLRLVYGVYPSPAADQSTLSTPVEHSSAWRQCLDLFQHCAVVWDGQANHYRFA